MKYRIAVNFGPYRFTADCDNVAVAFRHMEALILSPMYGGTPNGKAEDCADCLLGLADIAERRTAFFQMGPFQVEAIREGRRRG